MVDQYNNNNNYARNNIQIRFVSLNAIYITSITYNIILNTVPEAGSCGNY